MVPALLARGARVVLCGLPDGPRPSFDPARTLTLYGDITDCGFQKQLLEQAASRFGRIDALVNNAGVGLYLPAHRSPPEQTRRMFDVNLFAPLALVQKALPYLRAVGGGLIVNISSVGALAGLPWATMYCSTKYAMHCLSEGLYRELKGEGIHVLTVVPGIIRTSFRQSVLAGNVPETVRDIGGSLTAEEMATAIVAGMATGRRYVIKPWTARPFGLLNHLFPSVVDWYCATK
jgi:short-subunit dehydrogenase